MNELIRIIKDAIGCILTLILLIFTLAVLVPIIAIVAAVLCIIGLWCIVKWCYIEYITNITLFNKHKS
jgi:hypothetical protein